MSNYDPICEFCIVHWHTEMMTTSEQKRQQQLSLNDRIGKLLFPHFKKCFRYQ